MLSIPKKAVSLVFDALVWVLEKIGVIKQRTNNSK